MSKEKGKVVHDNPRIDLLPDKITADTVKAGKRDIVLQEPEGSFDPPAEMIQVFKLREAKGLPWKISEEVFRPTGKVHFDQTDQEVKK